MNLKYAPYSFSRINTYNQCPRKFKFQYIDKLGVFTPSKALDRGKLIHSLLEHNGDLNKVMKTSDWAQIRNNKVLTKDDIKEAIETYNTFKNSKIGKWIDSKTQMFNELAIAMDKHLDIQDYNADNVLFRGYIDKVIRDEDTLILIDYKTGKYKPDMPWDQLMYYGIALFNSMPFDKIIMLNVFVDHQKVNKQILRREDQKKYQKTLITNIAEIEKDTEFKKIETKLCEYCDFFSICNQDLEKHTQPSALDK